MLFVFDTNTLISGILKPTSIPAQAVNLALKKGKIIFSQETKSELLDVIKRTKFNKYLSLQERLKAIEKIVDGNLVNNVALNITINCKDLTDVKFLNLAFFIKANCIVSGDTHLKELHPFRGISIVNPRDFLSSFQDKSF